jgi:Protein of unknown function (DUF2958)
MKLLTKDLLAKLHAQDPHHPTGPGRELKPEEELVLVKFFLPDFSWTWYACSASKDEETGDVQFFGLVDGWELELGYFWLSELEAARGKLGCPMERDLYWDPKPLDKLMEELESVRCSRVG